MIDYNLSRCSKLIDLLVKSWEIKNNNPAFISSSLCIRGDLLEEIYLTFGEFVEIELCNKNRSSKINHQFLFSGLATKLCSQPVYGIYKVWLSI